MYTESALDGCRMIIDIFSVDTLWEPLAPSRVVILFRLLFHKWDNMPFFINFPLNTFVLETLCCMYLRIDETGPSISEDLLSIHYEKVEKKITCFLFPNIVQLKIYS